MGWVAPKLVGYVRCSKVEQRLTPEVQRAAIRLLALDMGAELVAVHEDIGISGAAPLERRPGLTAALVELRTLGRGASLVVLRRDRLARGWELSGWLAVEVRRLGARVITCDGGGKDSREDPMEEMKDAIEAAVGGVELAHIKQRTKETLAHLRAKGVAMGRPRFGMKYTDERDADGHCQLVIDPAEQATIMLMRRLQAREMTLQAIADKLNADDVPTRFGAKWAPVTVHRILARERSTPRAPDPTRVAELRAAGVAWKDIASDMMCSVAAAKRAVANEVRRG